MKKTAFVFFVALVVVLSGCVQYKPISLDAEFFKDRHSVIGVAAEAVPEADAHMLGGQGLLDIAINRSNAEKMIQQLKKLNLQRAAAIPNNLADALARRGFNVNNLGTIAVAKLPEFKADADPELYAPRDFRELKSKGIDRLLLVSVEQIGTSRNYYGFIPTGPPRALFTVTGKLVDLKTNKLMWYNRQEATAAIVDPWDQEPDFPNVSAAVLKNMADGATALERSLFSTPESAPKEK